ncbi:hypothetical protein GQ457_13G016290 [Hibiscus cannabinus]
MTRANPRGPRFDLDPEIERTQKQLKRRIRDLMERNNNNGQPSADGQNLHAQADGAIVPPAQQMNQQLPARTVRDYLAEDLEGLNHAVTMPEIEHFELRPVMFNMLSTLGQFGGIPNENARQHLKSFLEICNALKIHGVSNDVLKLKLFPYSLRDKAKTWLNNLQPGSLQSWTQLCRSFLAKFSKYFEPLNYTAETCRVDKPSIEQPTKLELKQLPEQLKYVYLGNNKTLPVIISSKLQTDQEERLIATLRQHKEALGWTIADIKGISPTICMHKILLDEKHKPTVDAQRRLNQAMKEVVRKEILKWLDAGIIYPISDSEWVSPVQCVPKKGGITVISNEKNELIPTRTVTGWRVCMDYRKLNKATRKDHFPLPFIDQMLDRLAGKQFYCFLDGYSGYNQIAIAPEDQSKTTFTCPYGTFAFRRMPFGLCNAPATFQRCMTAIFSDLNEDCLEIFMDDFSTFGEDFDSCLSNLEKVLKRCKETNLVLNWEKCHFMVDEGIVLGHKISSKGMEVDKAKIEVISKLPPPTTVKGIRSFLGHAGFYRRFIEDFSKITKPLCSLLEQGRPFEFNKDCTKAFNLLKQKLVTAPIVEPPDWKLPFELMCHASDYAVGAVLGQKKGKIFHPIYYANKTLNDAQVNYTTTEKEMLAVSSPLTNSDPIS